MEGLTALCSRVPQLGLSNGLTMYVDTTSDQHSAIGQHGRTMPSTRHQSDVQQILKRLRHRQKAFGIHRQTPSGIHAPQDQYAAIG